MKLFTKLFLVTLVITSFACEKKIDNPPNEITLNGNWNMKNVSGGLIGLDLDYNPGEVTWNFNQTTGELEVINNIITTGPKSIYARYTTGAYAYYISKNNSVEQLYIDSIEFGIMNIGISSMTIDDGVVADGFLTTFEK